MLKNKIEKINAKFCFYFVLIVSILMFPFHIFMTKITGIQGFENLTWGFIWQIGLLIFGLIFMSILIAIDKRRRENYYWDLIHQGVERYKRNNDYREPKWPVRVYTLCNLLKPTRIEFFKDNCKFKFNIKKIDYICEFDYPTEMNYISYWEIENDEKVIAKELTLCQLRKFISVLKS